jgi:hypothetical protein
MLIAAFGQNQGAKMVGVRLCGDGADTKKNECENAKRGNDFYFHGIISPPTWR